MIEVHHLTRRYGTHTAINSVSFEAKSGEILGLLGPNGAGKTTTMRILTGYMPPTEGTARVCGFDVVEDSMEVRRRVGYMPEQVPIYPDMTVESYVMFWAKLRHTRKPRQRVREVLEQFGLLDRRKKLVRSLSKGLRQRLGLAQALVHEPEVVILDEPTIGIDPRQVIEVRDFVQSLRHNHTVLFSSHILSEVEQVCDRVVILNQGKLVAADTPEILSQQLQPGTHLFIMVDRAEETEETTDDQIRQILSDIPQIEHVVPRDDGYLVSSTGTDDLRRDISTIITQHNLTLLEMRPVEITLEDIFLNIVDRG